MSHYGSEKQTVGKTMGHMKVSSERIGKGMNCGHTRIVERKSCQKTRAKHGFSRFQILGITNDFGKIFCNQGECC